MLINTPAVTARRAPRGFSGLKIVPPALVWPARGLLQNQGIDPNMLSNEGELDPQALFALAYDTVTIRTSVTPEIPIDLTQKGSGQVSQLVKDLQPVVTLKGRAGKVVIAPAGEPSGVRNLKPASIQAGLGLGAALLGLIIIGRAII